MVREMIMCSQENFWKRIQFGGRRSAARIVAGISIGLPLLASAQLARPDPTDAGATAPPPKYQSAFSDYRPFREEKGGSWKDLNKQVADNPGMGSMGSMKHAPADRDAVVLSTATPAIAPQLADGEIRKVDRKAGTLTIKHGPIQAIDMPAMTMVFQVKDAAMLDRVKAGDKVRFQAEMRTGGIVTVTRIEPAK